MTTTSPALPREHEPRYRALLETQMTAAYQMATLLGTVLFPLAAVLDIFTQPEHLGVLLLIRAGTSATFAILYLLATRGIHPRPPDLGGVIVLMIATAAITAMCVVLGGYASPYYAGVNLVILAGGVLFPWSGARTAGVAASLVGAWAVATVAAAGFRMDRPDLLVNNLYFLIATTVIVSARAWLADRHRREALARLIAIEEAEQKLAAEDRIKSRFFANVSHELRTPLSLILGPLEKLRSGADDPERARLVELVERNARILLGHVNDLLEVARLESDQVTLVRSPVDLGQLATHTAGLFREAVGDRGMTLRLDVEDGVVLSLDGERIRRVLVNLLANAIKFTPDRGVVRCTVRWDTPDLAVVEVADSGPGIPVAFRDTVFERFFQVEESATRRFGGTGLGLAIVAEFVALHGGHVRIETAPEGGASFHVELPRVEGPMEAEAREVSGLEGRTSPVAPSALRPAPPAGPVVRPPSAEANAVRVLVIEDNMELARWIQGELSADLHVEIAGTGPEGLARARTFRPDAMLVDHMLPGMDGLEIVRRVRADPDLADVVLIMLTARVEPELRLAVLSEGADDYLVKPFSMAELSARLRTHTSHLRARRTLQAEFDSRQPDMDQLAEEVGASRRALGDALGEVRQARDQAMRALDVRNEFVSVASHELRSPMSALRLHLEIVRRRITKGIGRSAPLESIDEALKQVGRLDRLVDDLLDVSRLESGRFLLHREPVQLDELVRGVCDRYDEVLQRAGAPLTVQVGDVGVASLDPLRIEQVLENLLSNAAKYGGGRPVCVALSRQDGRAILEVRDEGLGIPPEDLARIWEPFERAGTVGRIPGLGLGLYITRRIVEAHRGEITVESRPERGTRFLVHLPLAPPEEGVRDSEGDSD